MFKKLILLALMLGSFTGLKAQQPPCYPEWLSLSQSTAELHQFAPLSLNMPLEVIFGYIALDSAIYYGSYNLLDEFLERQTTFNDTLQQIMKHYYMMKDYDPILFKKNMDYFDYNFQMRPLDLEKRARKYLVRFSEKPYLDNALLKSSLIAHVKVTDTISRLSMGDWKGIATCEIIDLIKGQKFFGCKDLNIYEDIPNKKDPSSNLLEYSAIDSGDCLQLHYSLSWPRVDGQNANYRELDSAGNVITPTLRDENGEQWMKKDKEYIVFIQLVVLCSTENAEYYAVWGGIDNSETCNMYPIEEGNVLDPGEEFELGETVDLDEFKHQLRSRINEILSY
ncbi:MAG: hypothetical protein ACLFR2_07115 [Candidatus Kapaibacterium sp.]